MFVKIKKYLLAFFIFVITCFPTNIKAQCATPIIVTGASPYIEDFELNNGNWIPGGTASDWTWGTPSKPVIRSAGSGNKCWIIGGLASSSYGNGESSWLQSPCFDLTSFQHPYINFLVFWESENQFDGASLQYSIDLGSTWQTVGAKADAINCLNSNWYNYTPVKFLTGALISTGAISDGWSGNKQPTVGTCVGGGGSAAWVTAQHTMPYLAGKPKVIFRFVFGAGLRCNAFDGFAFDKITISEAPANSASFNYSCSSSTSVDFTSTSILCPILLWDFGDPVSGVNNTASVTPVTHVFSGPGTYTISLKASAPDNASSTATQKITIIGLTPSIVTPISCSGKNDGSVTVSVAGGVGPYSYTWNSSPVQNSTNATNLLAGTYKVTVSATNTCTADTSITLVDPAPVNVVVADPSSVCTGATADITTAAITSGSTPALNYTYYTDAAATTVYSTPAASTAGTYYIKGTNAKNCFDIKPVNVIVKSISSSITNQSICTSQFPYNWNGNNYNAVGSYTVHLMNAVGCDSAAMLNLMLKSLTPSVTNQSVCTSQLPYSWNGNNYNAAGSYTVHLTNAFGCDSTATLNLTLKPATSSTTNQNVCTSQLPYNWNGNTYNAAGSYIVHLTNADGCDSTATLVLALKTATSSITKQSVCASQLPYSWNGNAYNAGGTYTVQLTNANGCDSATTLVLTVQSSFQSVTNQTICTSQLPYSWKGNTYNTTGSYTVHLTNTNGCDSAATLVLTVQSSGSSVTNQTVCASQLPFSWNGNNYNSDGTYAVHLSNAHGCDSTATLVLAVSIATSGTTNKSICINELPFIWNGNNYNNAGSYTAHLTNAAGCDSIATLIITVKPVSSSATKETICSDQLPYLWNGIDYNTAGSFITQLTNSIGCDSVATLVLTVNTPTKPFLGSDTTLCPGKELILSPGIYDSYLWQDNSTLPTFTVTNTGNYSVVINKNGCTNSGNISVNVLSNCDDIYFPGAFSPNGDGLNDNFGASGNLFVVQDYSLLVFNRYGQLVFSSTNPFQKWEGNNIDKSYSANNFVWYAKYKFNGNNKMQKGNVILIR